MELKQKGFSCLAVPFGNQFQLVLYCSTVHGQHLVKEKKNMIDKHFKIRTEHMNMSEVTSE